MFDRFMDILCAIALIILIIFLVVLLVVAAAGVIALVQHGMPVSL